MEDTNIGNLTTYKVNSLTEKFINIENLEDLENIGNIHNNFCIIGGGTNLLMKENRYENKSFIKFSLQKEWETIDENEKYIYIKAYGGENLGQTIMQANKYTNHMNPLFGLPGTLSGAIIGNAGSYGKEIGEFVDSVELFDIRDHKFISMKNENIGFEYRHSILKNNRYLVISVILKLKKHMDVNLLHHIEYAKKRISHQPVGKTCGSWFKNYTVKEYDNLDKILSKIDIKSENDDKLIGLIKQGIMKNIPAGWLIEQAGLKGYEKNGVIISPMHANFIMNVGTTEGKNLFEMGELAKNKVFDKFDILLEEEVKIIED